MYLVDLRFTKHKLLKLDFKLNQSIAWAYQVKWSTTCSSGMNTRESAGTSRLIRLTNLNGSTIFSVRETVTTIKRLVFARNTYI
jgi:hypothetical protein